MPTATPFETLLKQLRGMLLPTKRRTSPTKNYLPNSPEWASDNVPYYFVSFLSYQLFTAPIIPPLQFPEGFTPDWLGLKLLDHFDPNAPRASSVIITVPRAFWLIESLCTPSSVSDGYYHSLESLIASGSHDWAKDALGWMESCLDGLGIHFDERRILEDTYHEMNSVLTALSITIGEKNEFPEVPGTIPTLGNTSDDHPTAANDIETGRTEPEVSVETVLGSFTFNEPEVEGDASETPFEPFDPPTSSPYPTITTQILPEATPFPPARRRKEAVYTRESSPTPRNEIEEQEYLDDSVVVDPPVLAPRKPPTKKDLHDLGEPPKFLLDPKSESSNKKAVPIISKTPLPNPFLVSSSTATTTLSNPAPTPCRDCVKRGLDCNIPQRISKYSKHSLACIECRNGKRSCSLVPKVEKKKERKKQSASVDADSDVDEYEGSNEENESNEN